MTILPGNTPSPTAPQPEPPGGGRQLPVGRRTLALIAAGVVVAGAGGWYALHSSGSSSPSGTPAQSPVHHPGAQQQSGSSGPITKAEAMREATAIFAVVPTQLPGFDVTGSASFQSTTDTDPVSRSVDKCFGGTSSNDITVNSPDVGHSTPDPTQTTVDVALSFERNQATVASDLAKILRPQSEACLRRAVVGHNLPAGSNGSLKFTSLRALSMPSGTFGFQLDGILDSSNTGQLPVQIVMLGAPVRATEILLVSTGVGAVLPLTLDRKILNAVVAKARTVVH